MIKQGGGGKIITVSSIRGLLGHPGGYAAYGTSKGAVHLLTRQLGIEWAKYKINVNSIAPCIFWTPLTAPILNDEKLYNIFMSRIPGEEWQSRRIFIERWSFSRGLRIYYRRYPTWTEEVLPVEPKDKRRWNEERLRISRSLAVE
jgi:NAD(P)-dependent dehydrogenase (short-subunit alcohol dehydrogenase family)